MESDSRVESASRENSQLWPQDGSIFKAGYQHFWQGNVFNLILINVPLDFMGQTTLVLLAVMDWHTCSCINKSVSVGDRKRGTCYVYKKYSAFMWLRILLLPEISTLPPNLRTLHHNFFCSSNLPYLDWPFLTFLQPWLAECDYIFLCFYVQPFCIYWSASNTDITVINYCFWQFVGIRLKDIKSWNTPENKK